MNQKISLPLLSVNILALILLIFWPSSVMLGIVSNLANVQLLICSVFAFVIAYRYQDAPHQREHIAIWLTICLFMGSLIVLNLSQGFLPPIDRAELLFYNCLLALVLVTASMILLPYVSDTFKGQFYLASAIVFWFAYGSLMLGQYPRASLISLLVASVSSWHVLWNILKSRRVVNKYEVHYLSLTTVLQQQLLLSGIAGTSISIALFFSSAIQVLTVNDSMSLTLLVVIALFGAAMGAVIAWLSGRRLPKSLLTSSSLCLPIGLAILTSALSVDSINLLVFVCSVLLPMFCWGCLNGVGLIYSNITRVLAANAFAISIGLAVSLFIPQGTSQTLLLIGAFSTIWAFGIIAILDNHRYRYFLNTLAVGITLGLLATGLAYPVIQLKLMTLSNAYFQLMQLGLVLLPFLFLFILRHQRITSVLLPLVTIAITTGVINAYFFKIWSDPVSLSGFFLFVSIASFFSRRLSANWLNLAIVAQAILLYFLYLVPSSTLFVLLPLAFTSALALPYALKAAKAQIGESASVFLFAIYFVSCSLTLPRAHIQAVMLSPHTLSFTALLLSFILAGTVLTIRKQRWQASLSILAMTVVTLTIYTAV